MDSAYRFEDTPENRLVYIRAVDVDDLPEDVKEAAGDAEHLYAVHSADGERLAIVRDRNFAFVLARQNDLAPVAVH